MLVRVPIVLLAAAGLLNAQGSSTVEYMCTEDDIRDFGLICDEDEPCQVFLELAGVEAAGSTLVVTGNLHTQNVTLYGVLLVSDDGGKTWTEPAKRLRSAALEHIQFTDAAHGWVTGVMLEPLPRDPFFMVTTDGGKTWRRKNMFDETRFGSIQQFWFDSNSSGELIIDRSQGNIKSFETYQSMTGGDTWELKEATRTQPVLGKSRRPAANAATWRLRVDAAAKAYRVESRTVGGWENLATFPVVAGECK